VLSQSLTGCASTSLGQLARLASERGYDAHANDAAQAAAETLAAAEARAKQARQNGQPEAAEGERTHGPL
jgi:hypothetical protein